MYDKLGQVEAILHMPSAAEQRQTDNQAITLLQGIHAEKHAIFAYVNCDLATYDILQRDIALGGSIDFSNYGTILAWGNGRPSAEIIAAMEEDYGFSHADVSFLHDRRAAAQP